MSGDLIESPGSDSSGFDLGWEWSSQSHATDAFGPVGDLFSAGRALESGEWVEAGLNTASGGLGMLSAISDPFGALISAGIGFILDHFNPPKQWLDDLCGDEAEIQAFAKTWLNVADRISTERDAFKTEVDSATGAWSGAAITAYKLKAYDQGLLLDAMAATCTGVGGAVQQAGSIVGFVRSLVRDAISELVGYAISKAAQLLIPGWDIKVLGDIIAKVAEWSHRLGKFIDDLLSSMAKLGDLLRKVDMGGTSIQSAAKDFSDRLERLPGFAPLGPSPGSSALGSPHSQIGTLEFKRPSPVDIALSSAKDAESYGDDAD